MIDETNVPTNPPENAPPATATPPVHPTPPIERARPQVDAPTRSRPAFSARPVGQNEFRIFEGERAVGKTLSSTESATVLAWIQSAQQDLD